jgi:protoheme IX farnesyltransferase
MFRLYADLIKLGIVIFVVLSGLAGYATSFAIEQTFDWNHLLRALGGLFFLSSGSLALNQVQEYKIDRRMNRTSKRPIAAGKLKPAAGAILSLTFLAIGGDLLYKASPTAAVLGWVTVVLYNGVYTYWWKPKMIFGAVPGAIPGALPVTIGYAANSPDIFNLESVYLFLIMFFWQMPHFWALAVKYREDYAKADVPTISVALGVERTLYHIGIYTFAYVATAVASPWFVRVSWVYLLLVVPFVFKILQEFYRFYTSHGEKRWLAFFMWVNLSLLVFLYVPVVDKWNFLFIRSN